MSTNVATVDATRTVAEAATIMLERDMTVLPVVADARLVGVVTMRDLLRAPPYRTLQDVMRREVPVISPDESITVAHATMEAQGVAVLPVVVGDRVVGLLNREDAVRALGLPIDPLTNLPWAVTMRERAVEALREGREIAILFFDLDDFGAVNKRFGHVTGDRCIKAVAQALASVVDPTRDFLCRYAGDEFAVLTTRPRPEAEALGRRALEAIAATRPPGLPADVRLTASVGIAGGKRTTERHDIHFQATVDDLITLASRHSTQVKAAREKAAAPDRTAIAAPPRLQVRRAVLDAAEGRTTATVELGLGPRRYVGEAVGTNVGLAGWHQLADATVQAVNRALPDGWKAVLHDVRVIGHPLETVVIVAVLLSKGTSPPERHLGSTRATGDVGRAVIAATLDALNRRLALILATGDGTPPAS
ncbi:MAG: GGDEF domain-containing protein [Armatimonadota bacterium]|nr:GGDEF domain-containing protein [Armatimonadota bacterium]